MDDMFRKLRIFTSGVRLTDDERAAMRSRLSNLVAMTPTAQRPDLAQSRVNRPVFVSFFIAMKKRVMPVLVIVLAFALSGGGAFAAEQSLPGDLLYPVKVHINEEVRSALSLSSEAKAEWESERAARRLDEAERLAIRGDFDAEARADIERRFNRHAENAAERTEKLSEKGDTVGAAHASSALEASLRAHARVLDKLAQEHDGEVSALAAAVTTKSDDAEERRIKAEDRVGAGETPDQLRAAQGGRHGAAAKVEEVRRFLDSWASHLDAEVTAEAYTALEAAARTLSEGEAQLEAGAYADAFMSFQLAHRQAQEAKVIIVAQFDLRVDVRHEDGDKVNHEDVVESDKRDDREDDDKRIEREDDDRDEQKAADDVENEEDRGDEDDDLIDIEQESDDSRRGSDRHSSFRF